MSLFGACSPFFQFFDLATLRNGFENVDDLLEIWEKLKSLVLLALFPAATKGSPSYCMALSCFTELTCCSFREFSTSRSPFWALPRGEVDLSSLDILDPEN